jgi:cephalosporin-C deacetylase-like acetyl esterase
VAPNKASPIYNRQRLRQHRHSQHWRNPVSPGGGTPGAAKVKAPPAQLLVTTERADSLYRQGETVKFLVRLRLAEEAKDIAGKIFEVQWTVSKEGVAPVRSGTVTLRDGEAVVEGRLDEPGFIQCRATCMVDGATLTGVAAAGVDPTQIKSSLPAPTDFDAFWNEQKRKLAAVPINARLTPQHTTDAALEMFDVQADCIDAPVSGYFVRPTKRAPRSLPAILTLHGAGVRSARLADAASFAQHNILALDINAHGVPNGQPDEYYNELADGRLKHYRRSGRESRETSYFLGMYMRVVRALDFLTLQPEWDGRTLIVYGGSQGGAQAIAAAGIDSRVTLVVAGIPAMCEHSGMLVGRAVGWPEMVPLGADGQPDRTVVEAMRYYDSVNFARSVKAEAFFSLGFIDPTCPPSTVYAAYNSMGGPKAIFNQPELAHVVGPKARDAMRRAVADHVASRKKLR